MTVDLNKVAHLHEGDRDLLKIKNAAYGNTGLRQTGMEGIATRIIDKAHRLLTLSRNPGMDRGDEAIEDTLRDISNYGILGRMLDDESLLNRPSSIYLAGPIDMADPEVRVGWQRAAGTILGHYGISVYAPYFVAHGNEEVKRQIMSIGFHIVEQAGMVLAYLPYDVPTLGTIREIHHAASLGKRVVVASPWAGTSAFSGDLECYDTLWQSLCAILEISPQELTDLALTCLGPNEYIFTKSHEEKLHDSGDSNSRPNTEPVANRRVRVPEDEPSR